MELQKNPLKDVEGEEAHIEDQQEENSESASFLFVASLCVEPSGQDANDEHVAQSHREQGQEEGEYSQCPVVPATCVKVLSSNQVWANGLVLPVTWDNQDGQGAEGHQGNRPNHCASHHCPPPLPKKKAFHWVHNYQKAEDAEAAKEDNTTVHVEVETKLNKFAHEVSKNPVISISIVVYKERKRH